MSSNPQQQAVEALIERFRPKVFPFVGFKPDMDRNEAAMTYPGRPLTLGEIVDCLDEAGLLITPQASSAERSDEDLVEEISRELRQDFRLRIESNTRQLITDGQESILLTLRECDDVAHAAVTALKKVTRA